MRNKLVLMSGVALIMAGSLAAQETPRFAFEVGAGFTEPVGKAGNELDMGWHIRGSAGVNFSQYVGAMVQLDYNRMGINSVSLGNLGFPGGDVGIFSATLDPIIHLTPRGRADLYIIGGGGLYHWNQEFTAPSVSTLTGFDPFFGFYPVAVPTTQVLSSYSVNRPGANLGAGIAFGSKWHGKFYAEARYHRIFMTNSYHTDYIPVSFGFRF